MESLKLSFESIMPIFLLMALGYALKNLKLADKKNFDVMNKLIFKVFLPVLLFKNIYTTELGNVFDWKLVLFTIVGVLLTFAAGCCVVMIVTKDNAKRGAMMQGFFRSNYAILGVPLVGYVCGDEGNGLASFMVAIVVPLFNVLAVICLERFRGGNVKIRTLLRGIVSNPLIIGCVIGLIFFVLDIPLPKVIETAVGDVAKIATPLALIVLGASFTFSSLKGYIREIILTVSAKLILMPLILLTVAILLGFRGEALACLLVVFGSPVAVSSFAMAQQMGADEKLAAQVVVVSSAACQITLFGWIFALNALGMF